MKQLFQELLEGQGRSQRRLARELNVRQSGISVALNEGRTAPKTLRAAAALAGRSPSEVERVLVKGRQEDFGEAAREHFQGTTAALRTGTPDLQVAEAPIIVLAFGLWGIPTEPPYVKKALASLRTLRADLEILDELLRARAALEKQRDGDTNDQDR